MIKKSIVALALLLGIALGLGGMPAKAQTMAEFAVTTTGAGMLAGPSALANYHSAPSDYQTEKLDNDSNNFADSTDNSANLSDTTNYAPSDYSNSDFSTSTEYKSVNDYSNATDMPSLLQ